MTDMKTEFHFVRGVQTKLKNRRVETSLGSDGDFYFEFTKLEDGKKKTTRLRLTEEATMALIYQISRICQFEGPLGTHTKKS